ncbi:hypothetical protein VTJ49DRAFT_718 [Mycothermus thermophilus]|uniref:Uncharacterized protein n=1 Tax=Humicola insolens TaxID=85995 RepID=A0ABR3VE97_HUMIN
MCLTKVYYNTYADGAQDITEKDYPCRDGRRCSRPDVRRYERKFPFSKLSDLKDGSHRSLADRQPTPYFSDRTPGSAKSTSKSHRRDSGVYLNGSSKSYDYSDPYGYDAYGYRSSSSRRDPRDDYDSSRGRHKRSSTTPHIVYLDRDGTGDKRSRSSSRDIPLGLVPLADEYGRRHRRHSSSSRERSDDKYSRDHDYARRRTDDPAGYTLISDADERRHRRRRNSTSSYPDPFSSTSVSDPYAAYLPRRSNSTVIHHSDGTTSTAATRPEKHIRWEDQVRRRRDAQNAEIASRAPAYSSSLSGGSTTLVDTSLGASPPKGILKRSDSTGKSSKKGKGREVEEDIEALRRSIERMELPPSTRGRDRAPRSSGRDDWLGSEEVWDYGYDGGRRKRTESGPGSAGPCVFQERPNWAAPGGITTWLPTALQYDAILEVGPCSK